MVRRVGLSDATTLRYDQLLIATGSRPRALPMLAGYENVSELRTIDDAQRLRHALRGGMRLAVVGAGFIGMEVASTTANRMPPRSAWRNRCASSIVRSSETFS